MQPAVTKAGMPTKPTQFPHAAADCAGQSSYYSAVCAASDVTEQTIRPSWLAVLIRASHSDVCTGQPCMPSDMPSVACVLTFAVCRVIRK